MSQHTLGSWRVEGTNQVNVFSAPPRNLLISCPLYTQNRLKEHQANARLIAAAPNLLEAVEKLSAFINNLPDGGDWELIELADCAISKATGRGLS